MLQAQVFFVLILREIDVAQGGNNAHIISPAVTWNSLLPSPLQRLPVPQLPPHCQSPQPAPLPTQARLCQTAGGEQCLVVLRHHFLAEQPTALWRAACGSSLFQAGRVHSAGWAVDTGKRESSKFQGTLLK